MASPLKGSATTSPILIQWASALVLFSGSEAITARSSAAAGRLPEASLNTIGQSTWSARWCRHPPAVFVIEA